MAKGFHLSNYSLNISLKFSLFKSYKTINVFLDKISFKFRLLQQVFVMLYFHVINFSISCFCESIESLFSSRWIVKQNVKAFILFFLQKCVINKEQKYVPRFRFFYKRFITRLLLLLLQFSRDSFTTFGIICQMYLTCKRNHPQIIAIVLRKQIARAYVAIHF